MQRNDQSRKVPVSSVSTLILTAFINSSVILPLSLSLAPHPAYCWRNLRQTLRFQCTCAGDFFEWASHPSVARDARHSRLPMVTHRAPLPVIQTGGAMTQTARVRAGTHLFPLQEKCLFRGAMAGPRGNSVCDEPRPCGGVRKHIPNSNRSTC